MAIPDKTITRLGLHQQRTSISEKLDELDSKCIRSLLRGRRTYNEDILIWLPVPLPLFLTLCRVTMVIPQTYVPIMHVPTGHG